jgi:pyruvate kinase
MNEYVSDVDRKDIAFACSQPINYIAASFVRRKEDILEIRKLLASHGRDDIKIIAKIESPEGVDNIDDIIEVSNGIMVARGDLGVEVELQDVPQIQKELIRKCNIAGKPVIVATHMLESMQTNPRPTRAEVSDVFNAILDGADAIMLSGESASGKYPVESVRVQNDIALKAEEILNYEKLANDFYESSNKSQGDAIGISVSKSVLMLDAKLVVVISSSFSAIRKLTKFKFKAPIIAIINNKEDAICLNGLYYGIKAIYNPRKITNKEEYALKVAKKYGVKKGESIIFVGVNDESKKADMMKIMQVK